CASPNAAWLPVSDVITPILTVSAAKTACEKIAAKATINARNARRRINSSHVEIVLSLCAGIIQDQIDRAMGSNHRHLTALQQCQRLISLLPWRRGNDWGGLSRRHLQERHLTMPAVL